MGAEEINKFEAGAQVPEGLWKGDDCKMCFKGACTKHLYSTCAQNSNKSLYAYVAPSKLLPPAQKACQPATKPDKTRQNATLPERTRPWRERDCISPFQKCQAK